eukprot:TRINITY_DN3302_c0_g1_i1.p1 TRINITY_DN3302_c0_g1~~TRINITY_DN3302_c0_g1_i1.p1  ORF type:complete len:869 (-),score=145.78 TRINITY_DN3302_c0_g1_i1:173-2779(-)
MSQEGNIYLDGWGNPIMGTPSFQEGSNIYTNSNGGGGYLNNLYRTQSAQSSFSQSNSGQNQTNNGASRPRGEAFFQHPGTNLRIKSLPYVEGEQQEELGRKFGVGTLWPVQDAIYKGYQRRSSPSPIGERPQAISAPVAPLSPTLFPWNNPELPVKPQEGSSNNVTLKNGHREVILGQRIRPHTFGEETSKNTSYSLFGGNQGNHPLDSLPISPTREDRSSSSGSGSHDGGDNDVEMRFSYRVDNPDHVLKTIPEDDDSYEIRYISDPNFASSFMTDSNNNNLVDGESIVRAPSADSIDSNGSFSPTGASSDSATSYGEHPLGEHPSRTLFVRNINSNVEDEELVQLFEAHGQIRSMYTQCKHRGFVMISYYDIRHAKNAMRHLQGKPLRRRKLDIHYSIPKDNPSEKDQNQGTLVIFNLDPSTTNEELKSIFGALGEIKEIRETPNKKHHKFIEFYDVRDAEKALKHLNKTEVKGKKIKIEPSRPGGARKTTNGSVANEHFLQTEEEYSTMNHNNFSETNLDYLENDQSNYFQHFPTSIVPIIQEKPIYNPPPTSSTTSSRFSSPPISPLPASSALSAPFSPSAATLSAMANYASFPPLQSAYSSGIQGISFVSTATNTSNSHSSGPRPRSSSGNPPPPNNTSIWISPEPLRAPSVSAPPFRQINSPTIIVPQKEANPDPIIKASEKDNKPNRVRAESLEDRSKYTLNLNRVSEDSRTTLMIRNIPNKYTQKMLLQAVDENHKGCYDFFYLPIDFKNKCNVGYAFINFISPVHIVTFYQEFNNKKWEKFNSEKVCELTYARIQGKIALIGHFQNSSLMCEDKKCRPIIFNLGEQEPFPIGNSIKRRAMSVGGKDDEALLRQMNLMNV